MSNISSVSDWKTIKFTEILDVQGGTQPPKSQFISETKDGYVRLLQIRDFGEKPVPTFVPDTAKLKKCEDNDILIGRYGASLGRICSGMNGAYNVALAKVLMPKLLDRKFVKYYLLSDMFQQPLKLLSRSAQNGFNKHDLAKFDFILPPLAEQNIISVKLDELLSQVDTIKARLEVIPAILKRFRQSVLSDAISGKLTEDWRASNKTDAKSDLEQSVDSKDDKQKNIEATSHHDEVVNMFPSEWFKSNLDSLFRFIDYRGKTPKKSSEGKRLISAKNIKMGYIQNEPIEYLSNKDYKNWMTRGFPKPGDIFFVTEGHTMGCVALNNRNDEFALAQRTITLQPYSGIDTKFYFYYILSQQFQKLVELNATGSAAKGIKAAKFRGLPVPFPSIIEQSEIVLRVEKLFSFADQIEQQVKNAQSRVKNLTNSILEKAFRGEVSAKWREQNQDLITAENSAEALLEKIKKERESLASKKKSKRKIKA